MPRTVQLRVLTRQPDRTYLSRFVYGEVRRSTRQRFVSDGANLPTGGTSFVVPRGTVALDELIQYGGQTFRVAGIAPEDLYLTRDLLTTNQHPGSVTGRLALRRFLIDDHRVTVDGSEIGVA